MDTNHPVSHRSHFAWARLNADTMLAAGLALFSCATAFFHPAGDAVTAYRLAAEVGYTPGPLHYVNGAAYLLAGVGMLVALARSVVALEVLARGVLVGGLALSCFRHVVWLGFGDGDTVEQFALLLLVGITSALRVSVLLGDKQVVISRPSNAAEEENPS